MKNPHEEERHNTGFYKNTIKPQIALEEIRRINHKLLLNIMEELTAPLLGSFRVRSDNGTVLSSLQRLIMFLNLEI